MTYNPVPWLNMANLGLADDLPQRWPFLKQDAVKPTVICRPSHLWDKVSFARDVFMVCPMSGFPWGHLLQGDAVSLQAQRPIRAIRRSGWVWVWQDNEDGLSQWSVVPCISTDDTNCLH